jgi:hypothetical protein
VRIMCPPLYCPKLISWPRYSLFRFFRIVKTLSQKEDTSRSIIFILNPADLGFLSSYLFRLVNKVSHNCFCKFMWLFMGLVIDIVFVTPLLSENEIKYIMYETVCLTPFSFPLLDGPQTELCGFYRNDFG